MAQQTFDTSLLRNLDKQSFTFSCQQGTLTFYKKLGEGKFGVVYSGTFKESQNIPGIKQGDKKQTRDESQPIAIKILNLNSQANNLMVKQDKQEMEVLKRLKSLNHENLVNFIDMFQINSRYAAQIFELCNQGDLREYQMAQPQHTVPQLEVLFIFYQFIQGYRALHAKDIIHRDIKNENILVHNGNIKIGDFGLSKILDEKIQQTQTNVGTDIFQAPEVKENFYTNKADVYSLGVVLYRLIFDEVHDNNSGELKLPDDEEFLLHPILRRLLPKMMRRDPIKRITWEELYNDPIYNCFAKLNAEEQLKEKQKDYKQKLFANLNSKTGQFQQIKDCFSIQKTILEYDFIDPESSSMTEFQKRYHSYEKQKIEIVYQKVERKIFTNKYKFIMDMFRDYRALTKEFNSDMVKEILLSEEDRYVFIYLFIKLVRIKFLFLYETLRGKELNPLKFSRPEVFYESEVYEQFLEHLDQENQAWEVLFKKMELAIKKSKWALIKVYSNIDDCIKNEKFSEANTLLLKIFISCYFKKFYNHLQEQKKIKQNGDYNDDYGCLNVNNEDYIENLKRPLNHIIKMCLILFGELKCDSTHQTQDYDQSIQMYWRQRDDVLFQKLDMFEKKLIQCSFPFSEDDFY